MAVATEDPRHPAHIAADDRARRTSHGAARDSPNPDPASKRYWHVATDVPPEQLSNVAVSN